MCTFNFCYCNNVCFFVSEKVSWSTNYVFDCCKTNHVSKYFPIHFYNWYEVPQVFQRRKFKWWESTLRFYNEVVFGTPNSSIISVYTYFKGHTELPFRVYLVLELLGDGDDIWSIYISIVDCIIIPKECLVILGWITLWFLIEVSSYLEHGMLMLRRGGRISRGLQILHLWRYLGRSWWWGDKSDMI